MKIGYACIPMTIDAKNSRSFMLKNFSYENFYRASKLNLQDLYTILNYNISKDIYMFRISSDIIPFGSHTINNIKWWNLFKEYFYSCGNFIKENNIRVSMHPGQYTVLNSPSEDVMKKSIKDIEYHTKFLDSLELDYSNKIVLHLGGVYNNKLDAMKRFEKNFKYLSSSAKKRLILENDERNYHIQDILSICNTLQIPAVFDNLHHRVKIGKDFDDLEEINQILNFVKDTWTKEDGNIKVHYSNQDPYKKPGAHSQFIFANNFLTYFNILKKFNADTMLEVKDKEISAIKCINSLKKDLNNSFIYNELEKYKYSIIEKNYHIYEECNKLINSNTENKIIQLYELIDKALITDFDKKNYRNALLNVFECIKNKINEKEKNNFYSLYKIFEQNSNIQCGTKTKNFLHRLCKKYSVDYILNSYYFIY
ncbi:UV DNA damage repair endonuclease UvsE [Clostridium sp. Marseille-Q2269]|uniref:UV DNA damage repair endonuclease UvsE n=1 Tax=Clostridium sp. Marseille-Q2269 TaxID=2942205 RepID=UPI0020741235|nr:UV DNA damage repair endonuclease UvsE [Clostridium sp. Marseille-Q2269]